MKHGLGQLGGSLSRGMESLKKSAQSRGGSTSVYCKGVRQLDNYGYEKYNLEDGGDEIFISRHSEKSMFNEDDSILVRATDGNFVTQPDTSKEVPVVEGPVVATVDARMFFGNVPRSDAPSEFQGIVGTVDDGKVVPVPVDNKFLERMAKPAPGMQKLDSNTPAFEAVSIPDAPEEPAEVPAEEIPVNNSFLGRMIKVTPVAKDDEEPEIMEVPEEPAVIEMPAEESIVETPAVEAFEVPETVETIEEIPEAPAEEVVVAPVEEAAEAADVPVASEEFFVGTEDETCEIPSGECVEEFDCDNNTLDDDYNMMFPDYEETEAVVEAPESFEVPEEPAVEQTVEEIPAVEAFGFTEMPEEAPEQIGTVEASAEEIPVAPVEEPVVMEMPVDVPEETEAVEQIGTVEAPVEEIIVAEPRIEQTVEVPAMDEQPKGMYVEGNEPGNVAVATAGDAVQTLEATPTGATAAEPVTSVRIGLDADGEALPPMSDPVVKRPRSVRFRFANGVLMSVDSKTEGSQEGPAHPLE